MASGCEQQLRSALDSLPRIQLASIRPTPLEHLPRLSAELGGPQIYIKRDDLTGLAFGGNKTRMLEFALADAQAKGAQVIVFGAAVQSNYCRQMAAACAKLGLELHLILRPVRAIDHEEVQGNHLLMRLLGAHVTVLDDADRPRQQEIIAARVGQLRAEGHNVYRPREEDTVDLDGLAYAESALEVVEQTRAQGIDARWLYVCALDTTQAGLVLGLRQSQSQIQVRGISPFEEWDGRFEEMARIANQGAERAGLDIRLNSTDFDNDNSWVGERYGVPTPAGLDPIRIVARSEGILLDPVYTSKAMSALIDHIRTGKLSKSDGPVVFLHTGGYAALFGYAADVLD